MVAMPRFTHPNLEDVDLATALHALADPVRLEMVQRLAEGSTLNCTATCPSGRQIPKSTLSNHFRILRGAGLVESSAEGREGLNRLRRAAFDARFPGLLDSVLANVPAVGAEGPADAGECAG